MVEYYDASKIQNEFILLAMARSAARDHTASQKTLHRGKSVENLRWPSVGGTTGHATVLSDYGLFPFSGRLNNQ
jgi:hypothetical protein